MHGFCMRLRPSGTPFSRLGCASLDYYSVADAPITTKRNHRAWRQAQKDLATLKQMKPETGEETARAGLDRTGPDRNYQEPPTFK